MSHEFTILMDIGNVLVDVDFDVFVNRVSGNKENQRVLVEEYCDGPIKQALDTGAISPFEFYSKAMEGGLFVDATFEEFSLAWCNIFKLRSDTLDAVNKIVNKFDVNITSDTDPVHFRSLCNDFDFIETAKPYHLSFEIGFTKKDARFFKHILENVKKDADKLILIDDKRENCLSAISLGIKSIQFESWAKTMRAIEQLTHQR